MNTTRGTGAMSGWSWVKNPAQRSISGHSTRLYFKDRKENTMDMKDMFNRLNSAFDEFRSTQDKRLDTFADDIKKITDRMDNLELDKQQMGSNPGLGSGRMSQDEVEYKNAILNYLIKGQNALNTQMLNSLSVGSAPDGGFWVPASTTSKIIQKVFESSDMRKLATVEPIPSDRLEIPKDIDEGTTGGWVGEVETRSDTDTPEVGMHEIPLHEQYAMPKATQKWLDTVDMVDAEGWLIGKVSKKLIKDENTGFVTGNGVMKPRGFTDYTTSTDEDADRAWNLVQHVPTGASGGWLSAASGAADPLTEIIFKLQEPYHNGAVFTMNRFTLASVATLKDADGRYILGTAKLQDKTPFEIRGYPVVLMADMPTIAADSLSIAFGNFAEAYRIIDHKKGLSILRDPFTAKPYVRFYCVKRTGGDLVNTQALKFVKFGTT